MWVQHLVQASISFLLAIERLNMAPFKSSKGRNIGKTIKIYGTSFIGGSVQPSGSSNFATGGTKITTTSHTYHVFTEPGSFIQNDSTSRVMSVLIVAGGGAGGAIYYSAGGGGGGVVYGPTIASQFGTTNVTVGIGGTGVSPNNIKGTPGSNSSFGNVTAIGGGGGGSYSPNAQGLSGGSSGGNSGYSGPTVAASAVTPQPVPVQYVAYGNVGGSGNPYGAGGGGGAGAVGSNAPSGNIGGNGGDGAPFNDFPSAEISLAIPQPIRADWSATVGPTGYYGGGGGGSMYYDTPGQPVGGAGGGGQGGGPDVGSPPTATQAAGIDFTGGGGGGANYSGIGQTGGSGIVIIKYNN